MKNCEILLMAAAKAKLGKEEVPTPRVDGEDLQRKSYQQLQQMTAKNMHSKEIEDVWAVTGINASDEDLTAKTFLWYWEIKKQQLPTIPKKKRDESKDRKRKRNDEQEKRPSKKRATGGQSDESSDSEGSTTEEIEFSSSSDNETYDLVSTIRLREKISSKIINIRFVPPRLRGEFL